MKTICFLFTIFRFGVLTLGNTYAEPPAGPYSGTDTTGNSNRQADSTHGKQANGAADGTEHKGAPSNADSHAPEKVNQVGPGKTAAKKPDVKKPSQSAPVMSKPDAVAKGGLPENKPGINSVSLPKPTVVGGNAALVPPLARKQAGPTASLGGLSTSSIKTSTAGINGTGMQRTTYR